MHTYQETNLKNLKWLTKNDEPRNEINFLKKAIKLIENEKREIIVDLNKKELSKNRHTQVLKSNKYDYLIKDAYIDAIKDVGVEIKNQSRWLNAVSVIADLEQIALIGRFKFVTKVTPIYQHKKKKPIQSHQNTNQIRNLDYGNSQNQIEQINCHIPHIAGYYGQGVRVLYIDTGYELNHEAYDSLSLIAEYDFINNDQKFEWWKRDWFWDGFKAIR